VRRAAKVPKGRNGLRNVQDPRWAITGRDHRKACVSRTPIPAPQATLSAPSRLRITPLSLSLMQRSQPIERSQVILTSGIISAVLAVVLLLLAYTPW
jgi:hypothetical protein